MAETYFKVYYSKDINKKKKAFSEGVFMETSNRVKLFDQHSSIVYDGAIKNKYFHNVESDEEFLIGNTYYVSLDCPISKESFQSGSAFMQKPPPKVMAPKKVKYPVEEKEVPIEKGSIELNQEYRIDQFIASKLRPHQVQGIKFMFDCISGKKDPNNFGCILADYMGLGKTLQTLTLLYSCLKNTKKKSTFNKAIVISPLSLVSVWERQHKKWFNDKIIPIVASGDRDSIKQKVESFAKDHYRLLFLSYESFIKHIKILNGNCDIIVFDEGHRLKNQKSKSYKTVKTFSCKRRVLLTGTPLQNNINQFYACICLVNPYLFSSQLLFKNLYKKPIESAMKSTATETELKLGLERGKTLTTIVKEFSLRRKGDVLQGILPSKKQYHIFFPLTDLQAKWSDRFVENSKGKEIMGLMTMLRKLIVSPKLFKQNMIIRGENFEDFHQDAKDDCSLKIQFIQRVAKNCFDLHEKLVVVSNYTQNLTLIESLLEEQGIICYRLDGSMSDTTREVQIDKFRASSHGSVFLLSSKAGGTGLNLTVANKMILIQPDWNPSNDEQVMGRLWRDGQTKPVHIYRLIAMSSFEQKILQRQHLKQSLSDKLVDSSSVTRLFNLNEISKLLILNERKCLTYEQEANQLNQVKCWNVDFKNVDESTFVCIRKEKNELNGVNEFDNDDMFLQIERQEDEDSVGESREDSSEDEKRSGDSEEITVEFGIPKIKYEGDSNQNTGLSQIHHEPLPEYPACQKIELKKELSSKPYINPLLKKAKHLQDTLKLSEKEAESSKEK